MADSIVKESSVLEVGTRTLVGCGEPLEETRVLIVNPTTQSVCLAGVVGEVWVAGAGIATGYWGKPEESDATFKATLAGSGRVPICGLVIWDSFTGESCFSPDASRI